MVAQIKFIEMGVGFILSSVYSELEADDESSKKDQGPSHVDGHYALIYYLFSNMKFTAQGFRSR